MNPANRSSGSHRVATTDEEREIARLWEALDKQMATNEAMSDKLQKIQTDIAVLQLKASMWTVIGAFIATALWFIKEIISSVKGK